MKFQKHKAVVYLYLTFFCMIISTRSLYAQSARTSATLDEGEKRLLYSDARLSARVTVEERRVFLGALFRRLERETGVVIKTDESDLEVSQLSLWFDEKTLRDVMDGIASVMDIQWVRGGKGEYIYLSSKDGYAILLPKNQYERDRNQAGLEVAKGVSALSPKVKELLATRESRPTVRLSDLPQSVQIQVRRATYAQMQSLIANGSSSDGAPFPQPDSLPDDTRVNFFTENKKNAYTQYRLGVGVDNVGSTSFNVDDYEERQNRAKAFIERERRSGKVVATYDPLQSVLSSVAMSRVPTLKRRVSLSATNFTYPEAVRALAEQARVDYATQSLRRPTDVKRKIKIENVSLFDALNSVASLFPEAEWGYRESGYISARVRRPKIKR